MQTVYCRFSVSITVKAVLKTILFIFACVLLTLPCALTFRLSRWSTNSDRVFARIGQLLSLIPGKIGSYLCVAYYYQAIGPFAGHAYLGFGSYFSRCQIAVDSDVYIGDYCIIGRACIGKDCTIGSHVNILSGKRQHEFGEIGWPIQKQGGVYETVNIGENCWIGNGAIIMANVGKQSIVGAGAVVTKDTGDYEVLAGNPGRVIRKLSAENKSI